MQNQFGHRINLTLCVHVCEMSQHFQAIQSLLNKEKKPVQIFIPVGDKINPKSFKN